jgi:hypothetical protein
MDNPIVWECDFLIQIAMRFPIFISKQPTGIFILHPSSFSFTQSRELRKDSTKRMKEKFISQSPLPINVTNTLSHLFDEEVHQLDKGNVISNLFQRNFKKAYIYAIFYKKQYGLCRKSLLFLSASWICLIFPQAMCLLYLLRRIKRFFKKKTVSPYTDSSYAEWL